MSIFYSLQLLHFTFNILHFIFKPLPVLLSPDAPGNSTVQNPQTYNQKYLLLPGLFSFAVKQKESWLTGALPAQNGYCINARHQKSE